ncbi:enoyl-CoA hydratase/isomerase [Kordiimonas pumila]|uniref:Enoyl-CoA hydratase/isomerase n=1 Tax=Kordiimonas pumila TaxID=2161677 RepID=A0ABV7D301_9PROT|nr:enoyl-CoA hydratase/isomerase [Kordiimonas pumila]
MTLDHQNFETLAVTVNEKICSIQFNRPEAGNSINAQLVEEFDAVTRYCADAQNGISILLLEGNSEAFSSGGDFNAAASGSAAPDAGQLYDIWHRMTSGPFVSISLVEGRVNAGGIGFIAASDVVLAGPSATFGLSEMLFGLFPACVLPFLIRRVGRQKAHYMTLMTKTIDVQEALSWHLVDQTSDNTALMLRQHLTRLQRLDKQAITTYKSYMNGIHGNDLLATRKPATDANQSMFSDAKIQANIKRYVDELKFPWEA